MVQAPPPRDDGLRVEELYTFGILGTCSEPAFDRLTRLACELLGTPVAAIGFLEHQHQWFKAQQGRDETQIPREHAVCAHAVAERAPLVIEDVAEDPRFRDNPYLRGPPRIRAYLGTPLISARGHAIGALCVQDTRPRFFNGHHVRQLEELAALVIDELELRRVRRFVERYGQLCESGPAVIFRWRAQPGWPIDYASASATVVLGYTPAELYQRRFTDLVHPEDIPGLERAYEHQVAEGGSRFEYGPYRVRCQDGAYAPVRETTLVERDKHGEVVALYGYLADVGGTEPLGTHGGYAEPDTAKASTASHAPSARDGTLTALASRSALLSRLKRAIAECQYEGRALAVIAFDVRDFRAVNDSLGRERGDEVLHRLGQRLAAAVGESQVAARLSGDEFAVLLPRADDRRSVEAVARTLLDQLEAPYEVAGLKTLLAVRAGIHLCEGGGCSAETLLEQAETALYQAKSEKARYRFFSPELVTSARERLELGAELREALAADQLTVHYQPQTDLISGDWIGVEALARWHHPERGWISPAQFIPAAERSGLIGELGAWVLEQACREAQGWLARGWDLDRVCVNVAAPQLTDPDFHHQVRQILSRTGLPASRLELEITESLMVSPTQETLDRLEALRDLGVRMAVDDFGTGYSTLSYLKDLPIDRLKVDRSFVRGMPDQPRLLAVTRAILALGKNLGFEVLAEGIETEHERRELLAEGCLQGQGFLFGRPVPAEQIALSGRAR